MESVRLSELRAARAELQRDRQVQERRYEARLATLAEFDAIKLQMARRSSGKVAARRAAMEQRSESVLRDIDAALVRVRSLDVNVDATGDATGDATAKGTSTMAQLARAKLAYKSRVDQMFPAWQQQVERESIEHLRRLERTKEAVNRRRRLAQKAFDKEKDLMALVAEREHDVRLLKDQERLEMLQREQARQRLERAARERAASNQAQQDAPAQPLAEAEAQPRAHAQAQQRARAQPTRAQTAEAHANAQRSKERPPEIDAGPEHAAAANDDDDDAFQEYASTAKPQQSARPQQRETPRRGFVSPTAPFALSYEWQQLPLGFAVPPRVEQRLSSGGSLGRMARLPPSWKLRVRLQREGDGGGDGGGGGEGIGDGESMQIVVSKERTVDAIMEEVQMRLGVRTEVAKLVCSGKALNPYRSCESLGAALFTGSVTAVVLRGSPLQAEGRGTGAEAAARAAERAGAGARTGTEVEDRHTAGRGEEALRRSDLRHDKALSFDELLGGGSEDADGDGDDDDDEDDDEEVVVQDSKSPPRAPLVGDRLRRVAKQLESDDDDDDGDAPAPAPAPVPATGKSSLEQFVSANKPAVLEEELESEDDFDF